MGISLHRKDLIHKELFPGMVCFGCKGLCWLWLFVVIEWNGIGLLIRLVGVIGNIGGECGAVFNHLCGVVKVNVVLEV